ncbi:DoxX family protein [Conexibacter sp. DBS9H8]|uniref:DoxX family protein n=1 Tax=Conexibacter sp. DBS9H8 TaxID=2937801 RepID=UPI00200E11AA|nr:DoxX family protein [Conexibacter sp. DBS9H8]
MAATLTDSGRARLRDRFIAEPDRRVNAHPAAVRTAIITGVIFIPAGLVKFVFHHWELNAFISFGLPWPAGMEILAGVLETVGGVLLILRRAIVPTCLLLAATMIVAIAVSGVALGEVIPSLTLAPALLVAVLSLLWFARA